MKIKFWQVLFIGFFHIECKLQPCFINVKIYDKILSGGLEVSFSIGFNNNS